MDDGYDSTLLRAVFRRQAAATTPDIPTRPPWTQATSIVYAVLVACALVLRLFSRVRFTKRFGADDLFASLGTVWLIFPPAALLLTVDKCAWRPLELYADDGACMCLRLLPLQRTHWRR